MTTHSQVQILSVPSSIDRKTTFSLGREIKACLSRSSARIALDMRRVESIDAIGLAGLVSAIKTTRKLGGEIALFSVQPKVQALLEITRIHRSVDLYDCKAVAITRLTGGFDLHLKAA